MAKVKDPRNSMAWDDKPTTPDSTNMQARSALPPVPDLSSLDLPPLTPLSDGKPMKDPSHSNKHKSPF